jgi:hypothetical protein
MATAKQIQYRMGQAKRKLAKVNKEATAIKNKMKKLAAALKKAKAAPKPKKKGKKVAKRKAARKR